MERVIPDVFDDLEIGITLHDPETGEIVGVNERLEELYGYSSAQLRQMEVKEYSVDEGNFTQAEAERRIRAAADGEPQTFEWHVERADGNRVWVRVRLAGTTLDGDDYVIAEVRDITERKEHEKKLEQSNQRLQQFAYVLSHDLQEPLRMVSSYVDLLEVELGDQLDEETREYMEFAVDGAERMQAMIDGLLQYSRVDTRGREFEETDLEAVLENVQQDLEFKLDEADATVHTGSLPTVAADSQQVGQLFRNLLKNAVDHGGEGASIEITATETDDACEIAVTDDGPGIPEDEQGDIFGLFEKGADSDGTGVGLAVCERIVDRHGGDIRVESAPGEGTTFSIVLPNP